MELVSRMMDGSISYELKNRFEPVLSGSGAQRTVEIELQEIPLFEGCSEGQLRRSIPTDPHAVLEMKHTREIAEAWKVRLQPLEVRDGDQVETRFALMKQEQASAVLTIGDNLTLFQRSRIVELAAKNRLPAMYGFREFVDAGGSISYGPDLREMFRYAAFYVDKILTGAKPGDLPIERPTKFELIINLKTAKALGLTIPPALLGRADEIIQ